MKKLILICGLTLQMGFAFATDNKNILANARYENVKMYSQPGTSTKILHSLTTTDEVVVIRRYNNHWSIVTLNGQHGYILTSELTQAKSQNNKVLSRK